MGLAKSPSSLNSLLLRLISCHVPLAVVFSEIYDGEIYDAGLEIDGWCETCKKDTRINGEAVEWSGVDIVDFDKTVMVSQFGCKPVIREKFPCKIIITPEGDKVLDFSQNMAGFIHMKVSGAKAGDIVELDCFETLDANGNVYLENLRSAKNRFIYTCKGTETDFLVITPGAILSIGRRLDDIISPRPSSG